MFSRAKPAGWAFGELLSSAQMNTLDINVSNAIDGSGGGPYFPSSPITIGGAGFQVTGNFTFSGPNFTVTSLANFKSLVAEDAVTLGTSSGDPVQIWGTLTGIGPATFVNAFTLLGSTVTIGGSASNNLVVPATAAFQSPVTFTNNVTIGDSPSDALFVGATSLFVGEVTVGAPLTCSSQVTCNGTVNVIGNLYVGMNSYLTTYSGRKMNRYLVVTANSNQTIVARNYDRVIVGNVLTASRDWTIDPTGLNSGESITLVNASGQQIVVKLGASPIWVIDAPSGNETSFVELVWTGVTFLAGPAN